MPKRSARFSFTLNSDNELDDELIEFLNSFATPSERRLFMREALYDKMVEVISGGKFHEVDRLAELVEKLDNIQGQIDKLAKNGIAFVQEPIETSNIDLAEAERGLENIWRK